MPHTRAGPGVLAGRHRGVTEYALFIFALVAAAVSVALGLWQGRRLEARRARNAQAEAIRSLPPVSLNNQPDPTGSLAQRRVTVRGTWDHPNAVLLRGRVERSAPGVFVVTPLLLEGRDDGVLVLRGFVPAADALRPDSALIHRPVRGVVSGIALPVPASADSGEPVLVDGLLTWRRLDLPALRARLPYPIREHYVHATADSSEGVSRAAFPRPATLPPLDDGPHLSYMIQWFGIAAVAVGFGVAFLLKNRTAEDRGSGDPGNGRPSDQGLPPPP